MLTSLQLCLYFLHPGFRILLLCYVTFRHLVNLLDYLFLMAHFWIDIDSHMDSGNWFYLALSSTNCSISVVNVPNRAEVSRVLHSPMVTIVYFCLYLANHFCFTRDMKPFRILAVPAEVKQLVLLELTRLRRLHLVLRAVGLLDPLGLFFRNPSRQCRDLVDQKTSHILDLSYHIIFSDVTSSWVCPNFVSANKHYQATYFSFFRWAKSSQIGRKVTILVLFTW